MFCTDVVLILLSLSVLVEQVICAIFFPLFDQSDLFSANLCKKMTVMCKNYPILFYISNLGKNNIVLDMFDICSYCKSGQYMKVICMDCSCICYIQLWTNTTKLWAYIVQYFLIFQICPKIWLLCEKKSQLSHIFKSRQTQNTWQSTSKRKWRHTDFVGHLDYTNILLQSVQEH
jgi:hypothetical protein